MYRLLFLAVIFTPSSLFAFNRAQTCISFEEREERTSEAPSNAPPCQGDGGGKVFFWNTNTLSYSLQEGGIAQFPGDAGKKALFDEIRRSFQSWEDVECSTLSFEATELSSSFGHRVDGENWIGFYDTQDWPHSSQVVAVTTITTLTNGMITDADIEINSKSNALGIDGDPLKFDLRNFLTHEIGHLIGLDHSAVFDATMQYQTLEGQIKKRDLHPDDEAGVCEIYPEDFVPIDIDESDGCCSTYRSKPNGSAWMFLSFLFIVSIRRLRR